MGLPGTARGSAGENGVTADEKAAGSDVANEVGKVGGTTCSTATKRSCVTVTRVKALLTATIA